MNRKGLLVVVALVVFIILVMCTSLALSDPVTYVRAGQPQAAAVFTEEGVTTIVYLGGEQPLVIGGFMIVGDGMSVTLPRDLRPGSRIEVTGVSNVTFWAEEDPTGIWHLIGS